MPFISCLVSKVATEWPYLLFYPPFSGLIPPNVLGIGQSYFVHLQTVLQISIPFQRSYRPTGLLFFHRDSEERLRLQCLHCTYNFIMLGVNSKKIVHITWFLKYYFNSHILR